MIVEIFLTRSQLEVIVTNLKREIRLKRDVTQLGDGFLYPTNGLGPVVAKCHSLLDGDFGREDLGR
jgi:hypothetical protein